MTRQNVTEGVREIMSRPCPTCDGEGVIRSEETFAIDFERRLREIVAENTDAEAFLVQINPRVTSQFTGQHSRVLHALEHETGKSFHFEGSEGLALDHFAITFQGTREEVEERALPFHAGDEVLVEIVEPHMYDVDDAVAKIDGYIISIAGASPHVGEKRMVRIEQVGRTAASALLLDENGEVVRPAPRPAAPPARRRAPRKPRSAPKAAASARASESSSVGPAATADEVTTGESAREHDESAEGAHVTVDVDVVAALAERTPPDAEAPGEEQDDDVQSKPRRRGRRGGRRRSTAKAPSAAE
jgi:ribonuclease G